jgi:hypothetical protein
MQCSTRSLEARVEQLEHQLAVARRRVRSIAVAGACVAAVFACRSAATPEDRSLRQLTIGNVRIDEFGITIAEPIGRTELKSSGVSVSDGSGRLTSSLGAGHLELHQKDSASAALDVTADASLGLQTGRHDAALRVGDDHSSLVLEHDATHTASISASAVRSAIDGVSGDTTAAIHAAKSAELVANAAGHALRVVADTRGARTEIESTTGGKPDGKPPGDR